MTMMIINKTSTEPHDLRLSPRTWLALAIMMTMTMLITINEGDGVALVTLVMM